MDNATIDIVKMVGQLGISGLLSVAVYMLWKQNNSLQSKYEAILERAISAIEKLNDLEHK